jgi:hypothetical protein
MGEFYSGVNIVGVVKETIEVFFRLGPLHVNVVYETKPGKWLVRLKFIKSTTPGDPLFQQMGTPQKKYPNSSISTFDLM